MANKNNSLGFYKGVLTTLITSLTITGVSYLDDQIWNQIMVVIGMITYSIVGVLFSIGLIHGKKAGKEAFAFVFIILLILGYCVYSGIVSLQKWILSWPLAVKIIVPIVIAMAIMAVVIVLACRKKNETVDNDSNTQK